MAASEVPVFEVNSNPPPRPFAVAAWLGMAPEVIAAGLADGSIASPPGAASGWSPPGFGTLPGLVTSSIGSERAADANAGSSAIARSQVFGWFHALDPGFSEAAFDAVWQRAGESDAARSAAMTEYLADRLLGTSRSPTRVAVPDARWSADASAALDVFTADPSHRAQVVDLSGMAGAELARRAQTDLGYRVAMSNVDGIALTGNRALFAAANADGHLDRFDPDTGESQLSEAWLADRGKFVAWKLAGDSGTSLDIGGDQAWTFVDRAKLDTDGHPLTVELTSSNADAQQNQVIFGAASSEAIKGSAGTDRIYGGGGDDLLRGAAGADHLEGGKGDDIAMGGAGDDELLGNQGDDELDGGRGADSLDGGSGDDTLTGGRGDDQLAGGDGADTYLIDAGDGTDTITDTDGSGAIVLDDEAVSGATMDANGNLISDDGRLEYAVVGDLAGESTLTIRAYAEGSDHGGNPDNVIKVQHWHNGDLGITLDANGQAGPAADLPGLADAIPDPQLSSDNSPSDIAGGSSGADAAATAIGADNAVESAGAWVDGPIVQAPTLDGSQNGTPASSNSFDVNAAIDQLLAPSAAGEAILDPMRVQHAVAAFSGVLAPPDISAPQSAAVDAAAVGITLADVAGALAQDAGGQDFGHESAGTLPRVAPDWYHLDEVSMPMDGSRRGAGNSLVGVARQ